MWELGNSSLSFLDFLLQKHKHDFRTKKDCQSFMMCFDRIKAIRTVQTVHHNFISSGPIGT